MCIRDRGRVEKLLTLMEPEEARDVRELMTYEEDTAGSMMLPDFVECSEEMTCQEVIELIRKLAPEAELVYYVYVVDQDHRLKGVLSLRDLIVSDPSTQVKDIMTTELLYYVFDNAKQDEVVEMITKYDLLAVPVLNEQEELVGIITFDDVMDLLDKGER